MQKAKIILTIFLALAGFGLQGAEIPLQELPKINDFAIVVHAVGAVFRGRARGGGRGGHAARTTRTTRAVV